MDGTESHEDLLRIKIFDALFTLEVQSIHDLMRLTGMPQSYVNRLTDHEWFSKEAAIVSIQRKRGA